MQRVSFERLCSFNKSHAGSAMKELKLFEPDDKSGEFLSFKRNFCVLQAKEQPEQKKVLFAKLFLTYPLLLG